MILLKVFKKWDFLIIAIAIVAVISFFNFFKAINFQYADWDGFLYLSYSKTIISGKSAFFYTIKSPILALIFPDLMLARIEMIIFHLISTALVYLITLRLTKNKLASLFSTLCYGVNYWIVIFLLGTMSDIPAMSFFLICFYFWLSENKKKYVYAGLFAGLAFMARFDVLLLIIPMIFLTPKKRINLKYFLVPMLILAIPFEILLDVLVFKRLIYVPYEFFYVNFTERLPFRMTAYQNNHFYFLKEFVMSFPLLSFLMLFAIPKWRNPALYIFLFLTIAFIFIPLPDDRIYFVKAIPLVAILASNYVLYFTHRKTIFTDKFFVFLFFILIIGINFYHVFNTNYQDWRLEKIKCLDGVICSNLPTVINYYCRKNAVYIYQSGKDYVGLIPELNATEVVIKNLKNCDNLIYFKHYFGYQESIDNYLKTNYNLIESNEMLSLYKIRK